MQDLVHWPGIKSQPPVLGAQTLNHWTTRKVPGYLYFYGYLHVHILHMIFFCWDCFIFISENSLYISYISLNAWIHLYNIICWSENIVLKFPSLLSLVFWLCWFLFSYNISSYFYAARFHYILWFLNFLLYLEQLSPSQNYKSIHPYFPSAFMFAFLFT